MRVKEIIRRLKMIGPVYFIWGNNDYEVEYDSSKQEDKEKMLV
jgi:predicted MPP superfamily phosphohydrolase